jgi:hypothetical protein
VLTRSDLIEGHYYWIRDVRPTLLIKGSWEVAQWEDDYGFWMCGSDLKLGLWNGLLDYEIFAEIVPPEVT